MLPMTKEGVGRASRHAIECEKYSLASEVSLISVIFQYGKQVAENMGYCVVFLVYTEGLKAKTNYMSFNYACFVFLT